MSLSTFRLPDKADRLYAGQLLDRSRQVRFTLDGESYEGFHGDTVLSALLAAGTDEFGHYRGDPVALDDRLHPPVTYTGLKGDPKAAMAMSRTPIVEGMELVVLAEIDTESAGVPKRLGRGWRRWRGQTRPSLSLDPESISPFPGPWAELEPHHHISADLIVVGGGAGGLAAARAGVERGWRVVLVEQTARLGGDATFFGSAEGEDRAADVIDGLAAELKSTERVEILVNTEALGLSGGILRAHQTLNEGPRPSARVLALHGAHVVLAPGAHERLPLFAGNRLPGVSGARAAHRLAANYGVWRGDTAIVSTASSAATQVALQASDVDIKIQKLADSRVAPTSRFFDFAKAYGVSLATGLRVAGIEQAADGQLQVRFELTGSGKASAMGSELTDRVLICGGWQSDLTLWNMAGGRAAWDGERQQLRAVGDLEDIALAGWCGGAASMASCIASSEDAVLRLSGARVPVGTAHPANTKLESDDGQLPISRPIHDEPACYLDNGYSFSTLSPDVGGTGFFKKALGLEPRESGLELRALSLNDVSAKVILGEISPEVAGDFAKERCVTPGQIETKGHVQSVVDEGPAQLSVPGFLLGRFGANPKIVRMAPVDGRGVEAGCLIFQSSNQTRPEQAIGVVLNVEGQPAGTVRAYVAADGLGDGRRCVARLGGRTVELELEGENLIG